jgi:cytochrome b561
VTIHFEVGKGISPSSAIKEICLMNSSKIFLLATLAAVTVGSHASAASVHRTARQGVHIYNMLPTGPAQVGGYDPGIETQR